MKERLHYIDIAKGIGIILVVWFHMPYLDRLPQFQLWGGYITTFYMPLFFLMSGLFYKPKSLGIKVRRLMIPYCFFYLVAFVVYAAKSLIKHQAVDWQNFLIPLMGGTINYQNTPIWFLLALAEMMVLAFPICKRMKKVQGITLGIVLGVIGYALGTTGVHIPYYIDVALLNMPFFLFAYYYKEVILDKLNSLSGIGLVVLSVIVYILFPGFTNVSQNAEPMGIVPFYVIAMSASLGIIGMMKPLQKVKVVKALEYFGENSLVIMCTHMMLLGVATVCSAHIGNVWAANLIALALIMVIEVPVCQCFNKYGRFLIGK